MSADGTLIVARDDGRVTLTLSRPERRNGLNGDLVEALVEALHEVAATPSDRALVITGSGGSFCSGMDLSEPIRPDELTFMRRVARVCTALHELPIPTIAAVRGHAIGFGCNLALCADFVLAAEDATFGEIFAERGLTLDGAGSWSLPRRVGLGRAKQLAFFGAQLSGSEAAACGMADESVPDDQLDELVEDWARRLVAGPRRQLSMMKAALNQSYETSFAAAIEAETVAQAFCFRSPEAREGVAAFREKRRPEF